MELMVTSPVAGRTASIDTVPDPVFAERMMGDGLAIHPLGDTICAPFDGEVITLHESAHAVVVRSCEGAEVLIHIGLDTVALKGRGFTPLVAVGDVVGRGDPLIRFDLDAVALAATSLVTPIIVTNADAFTITRRYLDREVSPSDTLLTLCPAIADVGPEVEYDRVFAEKAILALPHGIHARPAARIGACARDFEAEVQLVKDGKRGNARSTVSLLALGTSYEDEITVEARGPDAEAALAAIVDLLSSDMGERLQAATPASATRTATIEPDQIGGIIASPGLAIGTTVRFRDTTAEVRREGGPAHEERAALDSARAKVRQRIEARSATGGSTVAAIMGAHLSLLDDPQLVGAAETCIESGASAGFAWRSAVGEQIDILLQSGNAHLRERTADLRDIERQVFTALSGGSDAADAVPEGAIVIAGDLLPSQLVMLAEHRLAGLCLENGGPTSHVAVLCAGFGIPALVAMGSALDKLEEGKTLLLDAEAGHVTPSPSSDQISSFKARLAQREIRRATAEMAATQECRTADGTRIKFFANLGSVEDASAAAAQGAEGSGLVRSEFLFLDRSEPPSEDEQFTAYQGMADALQGRPVIVRLLDIGGDKPAAYIDMSAEENPALGLRGIRLGFAHTELLETQIRAVLRVRPSRQCRIMIPMVTSVEEIRRVRAIVDRLRAELEIEETVEIGAMVETPAAAATADLLAAEADFLSIGTNDLTQYVLAMDRGNPSVAAGVDAMHPAVLRMIDQTCRLASTRDCWVGVCGGLASDPAALQILIGLGVTELSSVPGFVAEGKAVVRTITMTEAQAHAARALQATSAADVRTLCVAFSEKSR